MYRKKCFKGNRERERERPWEQLGTKKPGKQVRFVELFLSSFFFLLLSLYWLGRRKKKKKVNKR